MLVPGPKQAEHPAWGQEVTVKMQGVLEDRTVVEKDPKLVFVIGEGDVNQVGPTDILTDDRTGSSTLSSTLSHTPAPTKLNTGLACSFRECTCDI